MCPNSELLGILCVSPPIYDANEGEPQPKSSQEVGMLQRPMCVCREEKQEGKRTLTAFSVQSGTAFSMGNRLYKMFFWQENYVKYFKTISGS